MSFFRLRVAELANVLCLGEMLVDWVSTKPGEELDVATAFTKAAGGAPANVAVGLARQGVKAAFIGRISKDAFGKWLKKTLDDEGVDTAGVVLDGEAQTRMAYVVTLANGDRKLAEFSNISVADTRLEPADLREQQFSDARALHFGSISMICDPAAAATRAAINLALKHKLLISFDPNVRLGLWNSEEVCRNTILSTLKFAHLVKINLDELEFLSGSREFSAAETLRQEHNIPLLIITLDAQGSLISCQSGQKIIAGFEIDFVEATGAGDGFVSGLLLGLLEALSTAADKRQAIAKLSIEQLSEIALRANAVGALACTRAGAIPALPSASEVKLFLQRHTAKPS